MPCCKNDKTRLCIEMLCCAAPQNKLLEEFRAELSAAVALPPWAGEATEQIYFYYWSSARLSSAPSVGYRTAPVFSTAPHCTTMPTLCRRPLPAAVPAGAQTQPDQGKADVPGPAGVAQGGWRFCSKQFVLPAARFARTQAQQLKAEQMFLDQVEWRKVGRVLH